MICKHLTGVLFPAATKPLLLALKMDQIDGQKFKVIFSYIMNLRSAWATRLTRPL